MADSEVVGALIAKRRELASEAEGHRRELERLAQAIGHVEATIRLFAPDCALGGAAPRKRRARRQRFASGECQRLVLEALRDAVGPLTDRGVAAAVAARKGETEDSDLAESVLAVLRRLVQKGAARTVAAPEGERAWERV